MKKVLIIGNVKQEESMRADGFFKKTRAVAQATITALANVGQISTFWHDLAAGLSLFLMAGALCSVTDSRHSSILIVEPCNGQPRHFSYGFINTMMVMRYVRLKIVPFIMDSCILFCLLELQEVFHTFFQKNRTSRNI